MRSRLTSTIAELSEMGWARLVPLSPQQRAASRQVRAMFLLTIVVAPKGQERAIVPKGREDVAGGVNPRK